MFTTAGVHRAAARGEQLRLAEGSADGLAPAGARPVPRGGAGQTEGAAQRQAGWAAATIAAAVTGATVTLHCVNMDISSMK